MRLKVSLFILCVVLLAFDGLAQHILHIQAATPREAAILSRYAYQSAQPSAVDARRALQEVMEALYENGYLLAHAQTFRVEGDTSKAVLAVGQPFSWAVLGPGNVEPSWLSRTAFREKDFIQRPFKQAEVAKLMQQLVIQAENRGYPFAALRLDSVRLDSADNTALHASLNIDKGPFISFDTVVVRGNARLSASYLSAHLGIKPGQPYSRQTLETVAGRLQQLPFVRLEAAPTVSYQNRQATIYVKLAQKRANRLDGIIGLLPNPQEAGRFLFTGQFDLLLQNPFGGGKQIGLQWQRFSPGSQNLETFYRHPYLFGAPLSFELGFGLLKESEAFVNRQLRAGVQLKQGAYNTLRLGVEHKDSRLLAQAASGEHAGFSLAQYGIGFNRQRINDPFAPQKGYELSLDFSGGQKKVHSLPLGGADSTAQSLSAAAMQYRASGHFRYYWPLFSRLVWAHGLEGGLISDKQLFQNDLYRLGGLNSLRGFREKNFFVSDFVLSRLELRYLAGSETYFFLFYDQAWMAQRAGNLHVSDWPMGFGAGLNLGTNSGTFNFVYGLGKSDTQPIGLSSAQVHFGYINRF
jgi:outer membrane protein assembly factor BamA